MWIVSNLIIGESIQDLANWSERKAKLAERESWINKRERKLAKMERAGSRMERTIAPHYGG